MPKKSSNSGKLLVEVYDRVTCLEHTYKEMKKAELERLSSEMYNVVVDGLIPKRKVLLNELLDCEVELRLRNEQ